MQENLTKNEINKFKEDGAILLKSKFDQNWIEKLKKGIDKDIKIQVLDLNLIQKKMVFLLI